MRERGADGEGVAIVRVFAEAEVLQEIGFQVVLWFPGVPLVTVALPLDQEEVTPLLQLDVQDRLDFVDGRILCTRARVAGAIAAAAVAAVVAPLDVLPESQGTMLIPLCTTDPRLHLPSLPTPPDVRAILLLLLLLSCGSG